MPIIITGTTFTGGSSVLAPTNGSLLMGTTNAAARSRFLSVPASTAWDQTGSFTAEWWFRHTTVDNSNWIYFIFSQYQLGGYAVIIDPVSGTTWRPNVLNQGNNYELPFSGTLYNLNTWYHMAITSNGTNGVLYVNGAIFGTWVDSNTKSNGSGGSGYPGTLYIGSMNGSYIAGATSGVQGNISNFRWTKGVIVYTGVFTPPTRPLTVTQDAGTNISAITAGQTQLLLNTTYDNNFLTDSSTNNFTVTNNDIDTPFVGVTSSALSPF